MKPLLARHWLALGLLAFAFAARGAPPAAAGRAPEETAWRPAAPGLELSLRAAGGALLVLLRADPAMTKLRVVHAGPDTLLTAAEVGRRDGALAVINASFFDDTGRPIGWIVSAGRTLAPPAPKGWGAFVVSGGQARIIAMKDAHGPADEALQAGPRLVIAGAPNPDLKAQVARRAFVGVDAQGRIVLGATGPTQVSATELAAFLAKSDADGGLGLVDALNLDGGSSAQLFARVEGEAEINLVGIPVPVLLEILPGAKPAP